MHMKCSLTLQLGAASCSGATQCVHPTSPDECLHIDRPSKEAVERQPPVLPRDLRQKVMLITRTSIRS